MLFKPINMKTFLTKISFMVLTKRFSSTGPTKDVGTKIVRKIRVRSHPSRHSSTHHQLRRLRERTSPKKTRENTLSKDNSEAFKSPKPTFKTFKIKQEYQSTSPEVATTLHIPDDNNMAMSKAMPEPSQLQKIHEAMKDGSWINIDGQPQPTLPTSAKLTTDEILKIQKAIPHPPLQIPQYTQIPDFSQEKDKAVIKQETVRLSRELSDNQLIKELVGRGFIKVADTNMTKFKTISGETIVVGKAKNNIKITPFGKAYVDKVAEKASQPLQAVINVEEHLQYHLAALSIDDKNFLLDGPQKHVVVVYDKGQNI